MFSTEVFHSVMNAFNDYTIEPLIICSCNRAILQQVSGPLVHMHFMFLRTYIWPIRRHLRLYSLNSPVVCRTSNVLDGVGAVGSFTLMLAESYLVPVAVWRGSIPQAQQPNVTKSSFKSTPHNLAITLRGAMWVVS